MKTLDAVISPDRVSNMKVTDGAGVNPDKVIRTGKRVRNLHRHAMRGVARHVSLRQWVLGQVSGSTKTGTPDHRVMLAWLGRKGMVAS